MRQHLTAEHCLYYTIFMKQIVIVHGGSSFDSYDNYLNNLKSSQLPYERLLYSLKWREWLTQEIIDADVLLPNFPNKQNANYAEWVIYFEKLLPLLGDDVQLVGYSLGAMFLVKYLQEKPLEKPVRRLILAAPCYDDESLEDLGSFRIAGAKRLEESAKDIHFFHSKDDPVVPFTELAKFQEDLPSAKVHIFEDRGHFFQATFPELKELLQQK